MKTLLAPLALLLVAVAVAAPPIKKLPAYGAIQFGMTPKEVEKAGNENLQEMVRLGERTNTLAAVRRWFIVSGTPYEGTRVETDPVFPITTGHQYAGYQTLPGRETLAGFDVGTGFHGAENYEKAKAAWEALRALAASKFGQGRTVAPWPDITVFPGDNKGVITDTWLVDGVRIDLRVGSPGLAYKPKTFVHVTLRAMLINPPPDAKERR